MTNQPPGTGADGTVDEERPTPAEPVGKRRLSLGDPLSGVAAEDRPESWGEHDDSDAERLARYLAARPPHHGG